MSSERTSKVKLNIINFCMIPRTIPEVAEKMEHSYHTARSHMHELQKMGALEETLRTRNKAALWQTTEAFMVGGWKFEGSSTIYTPLQLLEVFAVDDSSHPLIRISNAIAQIMATIYMNDQERKKGEKIWGFPDNNEDARKFLIAMKKSLEGFNSLVDQLLDAPVWGGDADKWFDEFKTQKDAISKLRNQCNASYRTYYDI